MLFNMLLQTYFQILNASELHIYNIRELTTCRPSQFRHLLAAHPVRAPRRLARPPGARCPAAVHGAVAEERQRGHVHCPAFGHVHGAGDRPRRPVLGAAQHH